jgi:aspartyl-tRNA synthetase
MKEDRMKIAKRSHCGKLGLSDRGKEVHLKGWVDALRDHGEVLFIHLRDRSGIVQVVFNPEETPATTCKTSQSLRSEFCISVSGFVKERNEGTENPNIETGTIEVVASDLEILSSSKPLPFPISEKAMVAGATVREIGQVAEDTRLQYRYLDLRRPTMQKNLEMRHQIIKCVRDYLDKLNFVEVETPMLTKSTPEGARDYLVPSRIHPGRFYALPQSPQLFKQLLMVSGIERYFQIVRCFRDEDLRPNRQPEFTQLDLEASFIDEEDIYDLMEELVVRMFTVGDITVSRPFPRMTWTEAMDSMGTDRPDTRFDLRFIDATDIFKDTSYGIFSRIVEKGGFIKGINVKGQSDQLSKNVLQNEYANKIIPSFGGKGMTWMRAVRGTLESNIVQFFSEEEKADIRERFKVRDGDVIIMIADTSYTVVSSVLGQLREHLARRLDLIDKDRVCPVWVTRFPLFTSAGRKITSNHHPFTAPERSDFDPNNREELLALKSRAYDLVVNGEELGGGSMRIHDSTLQRKIFQALGLQDSEVRKKFGFFLKALEYGAPPHGGIALGLDRVISMILGTETIRDVMAFPKNRSASCPLSGAPSTVGRRQLSDLGLLNLDSGRWVDGKKIMVG